MEPLSRALSGLRAWVTGQRREQAVTRRGLEILEIDEAHDGILKLNPLVGWTEGDVTEYVRKRGLPVNRLHDMGYPSIGCAPCTRAVAPGEDPRAGRWWWERPEHKECGLHARNAGRKRPSRREGERRRVTVDHLDALENQSIYIFREAYRKFKNLAMLWSIGKDSTTLLWLARKAFFGKVPVPARAYRHQLQDPGDDRVPGPDGEGVGRGLIVGKNEEAICCGDGPGKGRIVCCNALKTKGCSR